MRVQEPPTQMREKIHMKKEKEKEKKDEHPTKKKKKKRKEKKKERKKKQHKKTKIKMITKRCRVDIFVKTPQTILQPILSLIFFPHLESI